MNLPEPIKLGPSGGALWEYNLLKVKEKLDARAAESYLKGWLLYAPWAHPLWSFYSLSLLKVAPYLLDPKFVVYLPGCTHEVILSALDPVAELDLNEHPTKTALEPINFAAQIRASSDEEAVRYCLRACYDVVDGVLNPDTDGTQQWVARFGDNMVKK